MENSKFSQLKKPSPVKQYSKERVLLLSAKFDNEKFRKPNTLSIYTCKDTPANRGYIEKLNDLSNQARKARFKIVESTKQGRTAKTVDKWKTKANSLSESITKLVESGIPDGEIYTDNKFAIRIKDIANSTKESFQDDISKSLLTYIEFMSKFLGDSKDDFRASCANILESHLEKYNFSITYVKKFIRKIALELRHEVVSVKTDVVITESGRYYAYISRPLGQKKRSSRSYYGGRTIK